MAVADGPDRCKQCERADGPAARIEFEAPFKPTRLHDSVVGLSENFRFAKDSGIGRLAAHLNAGEPQAAIEFLRSRTDPGNKAALFEALGRFRVLCAEREGPRGVDEINRFVGRHFRDALEKAIVSPTRRYSGLMARLGGCGRLMCLRYEERRRKPTKRQDF